MRMDYSAPARRTFVRATSLAVRQPLFDRAERQSPEVIFVTNRGPVEHSFDTYGSLVAERGAGGVVSGLLCAAQERRVTWISLAMTEADRAVARHADREANRSADLPNVVSRLVDVPPTTYHRYYAGFSNRVLWFLQHGLAVDSALASDQITSDWRDGYVKTNESVASAVTEELARCQRSGSMPPVVFHDYHLYLAPALVRQRAPQAQLQHFIHIPWPAPETWARLPTEQVCGIYAGLAANDLIGFQTERDVRNFLAGAARYLPGAVRMGAATLRWQGRDVRIAAYPIALNSEAVVAQAHAPQAEAAAKKLLAPLGLERGRKLILRVDRLEPTKNIVRGFEAYERLLSAHEELRERVVFLALLVPSREGLPIYQRYADEVRAAIDRVNRRFGTADWQPVVAVFGNDHARALACMRFYDVLLVNPLIDGMNLVVKEGAIVNERAGVIALSTEAGAYAQLAEGVLRVAPRDVEATSDALLQALTLEPEQRKALAASAHAIVRGESAGAWLRRQLRDLSESTAHRLHTPHMLHDGAMTFAPRQPLDPNIAALEGLGGLDDFADVPMLPFSPRNGYHNTRPLDDVEILSSPA